MEKLYFGLDGETVLITGAKSGIGQVKREVTAGSAVLLLSETPSFCTGFDPLMDGGFSAW